MADVGRSHRNWLVDESPWVDSARLVLAEADLPDDVEALRALVLEQDRKLENADAEVTRLRAMLDAFTRHRFGARSEKLDADQLQLGLEDVETAVAGPEAANDAKSGFLPSDRPRKRNRGALPAHLERVEQVVEVESKDCPCCGGALHRIGEDAAERLDVVPTTFRVLVTRRPRYGCRSCEGAVVQAPAPPRGPVFSSQQGKKYPSVGLLDRKPLRR